MRKFLTLFVMLVSTTIAIAQNKTVTGKVTDEKGAAVANASVLVKGTSKGVTTSADGNFSISVPTTAKTLVISSVGFGNQEVGISKTSSVSVTLQSTASSLDEVVVVGYGTQKKTSLTGSVTTIKGAAVENKPFSSVDKGLQGLVAGLQSTASSGAPGATQDIRIRGISSINAGSAPIWVIDGVIALTGDASRLTTTSNLLGSLNPNDIESISVLKDAASTSVYGARGANGVIIVTTKKGKAGATKFTFSGDVGENSTAYQNDERNRPLNAKEYIDLTTEGLVNLGATQAQINATLTALGNGNGNDFNWLNAITKKGTQQSYNLSASGGTDKTSFYLSGGYYKQFGTVIGSDLERYSAAFRVSNQATSKLTLNFNVNGSFGKQNTPLSGGSFGNAVLSSYFILPTFSAYKADGTLNYLTADFPLGSIYNTLAVTQLDKRQLGQLGIKGSFSADYKILDNLTFRSQFSGDFNNLEENQYNNPFYGDGVTTLPGSGTFGPSVLYNPATTGRAFAFTTRYFSYTFTNTLDYKAKITKNGDLKGNLKLGYEATKTKGYFTSLQGTGFPLTLALQYPASTATPRTASATITENAFISQFAIGDLNYKDRYIISGSYRRDGSSRFGINNQYGTFWSVGASWNVSNEEFLRNVPAITQLKIRGSYGRIGNAAIGDYDYFPGYGFGANYNSTPGSAPNNVGNLDLTWEVNKPLDIGFDLSLFKSRVNLTVDYYKRVSSDLLLDVPLSRTAGFTTVRRNIGALQNKGIEVTLNVVPVQTKNFTWTVDFNYSRNKNQVTSLPDNKDIVNGLFIYRTGSDVQSYYLREYAGVDPANGDPLWYADSSRKATQNVYSTAKRTVLGSASPQAFGSLTNSFKYKNFSLSFQFYYSYGNFAYDAFSSFYLGAGANPTFNKVNRILGRWQKPGDQTDIPRYIYNGNKSFQSASTFYLNNSDYIRLRDLTVGYSVPQSLLTKAKMSNISFYVRGTNLFTFVKDKNLEFDPEQGIASRSNLNVFIPKTITVGLTLGF